MSGTGINIGRARITRKVQGLLLEGGREIAGGDLVMQHDSTGYVRTAEDLPGYTVIGQADQPASALGKKDGEVSINVLQGEMNVLNDEKAPVTGTELLRPGVVFVTARNTVGTKSAHKVKAGTAISLAGLNGPQVSMLISAGY